MEWINTLRLGNKQMEGPHPLNSVLHMFLCLVSLCAASTFLTDSVVMMARDEGERPGVTSCLFYRGAWPRAAVSA